MSKSDIRPLGAGDGIGRYWIKQSPGLPGDDQGRSGPGPPAWRRGGGRPRPRAPPAGGSRTAGEAIPARPGYSTLLGRRRPLRMGHFAVLMAPPATAATPRPGAPCGGTGSSSPSPRALESPEQHVQQDGQPHREEERPHQAAGPEAKLAPAARPLGVGEQGLAAVAAVVVLGVRVAYAGLGDASAQHVADRQQRDVEPDLVGREEVVAAFLGLDRVAGDQDRNDREYVRDELAGLEELLGLGGETATEVTDAAAEVGAAGARAVAKGVLSAAAAALAVAEGVIACCHVVLPFSLGRCPSWTGVGGRPCGHPPEGGCHRPTLCPIPAHGRPKRARPARFGLIK